MLLLFLSLPLVVASLHLYLLLYPIEPKPSIEPDQAAYPRSQLATLFRIIQATERKREFLILNEAVNQSLAEYQQQPRRRHLPRPINQPCCHPCSRERSRPRSIEISDSKHPRIRSRTTYTRARRCTSATCRSSRPRSRSTSCSRAAVRSSASSWASTSSSVRHAASASSSTTRVPTRKRASTTSTARVSTTA